MILVGASGHAKVVIDMLVKSGRKIDYLLGLNKDVESLLGYPVRPEEAYIPQTSDELIVCIGSNKVRKSVSANWNLTYGIAVHPSAQLAQGVEIEGGTVVMAGGIINVSTKVGKHCIINTGASIDHDCTIADFVHISPKATLCGTIEVGEGTQVGAGAIILPNLTIGKWVTIGAGAVITKDVPDNAVLVGNPGKIVRYNE